MIDQKHLNSDHGAVLIIAMLILLLISLLGKSAIIASSTETGITANHRRYKITFNTAEAGLEQAIEKLQMASRANHQARIASGGIPDWDFALNGSIQGINPAAGLDFRSGAVWIMDQLLEDLPNDPCTYTVVVWNNSDDPGGPNDDTDQRILVHSVASGLNGAKAEIQAVLRCQAKGETITGYFSQSGIGANNSLDLKPVETFIVQ